MKIKYLFLLTFLIPLTTQPMQTKKDGAMNEGTALSIGAAGALAANLIPAQTLQESILYNVAGFGLSTVGYLITKSMKTADTGLEFGRKYIYYIGGFVPTAIALICLKEAIKK